MTSRRGRRGRLIASLLLWKGAWLAAVVGAGRGIPAAGTIVAGALIAVTLVVRGAPAREVALVGGAGVLGFAVDSALVLAGCFSIAEGAELGVPSTLWMALLWSNLVAHLAPGSLFGGLEARPRLAGALGAASGPLAYLGGAGLGAVRFPESPVAGLIALAVVWGIVFPSLFVLRRRVIALPVRAEGALQR